MPPNKAWMNAIRNSQEYFDGVKFFLDYAYRHVQELDGKIFCPCVKCVNRYRLSRSNVHEHLLWQGITRDYTNWHCHGENGEDSSDSEDMEEEDCEGDDNVGMRDDMDDLIEDVCHQEEPNGDAEKFYRLLEESQKPLYPNCKQYSNFLFVVKLMHIKSICLWSNKSFNMLLELLKDAYPMSEALHSSNYEAKKMVKDLGLHYEKIDACQNDCVIYYKEHSEATQCPTCGLSRWKTKAKGCKKIPWKVLRYFPITPRLQRIFMSNKTAANMRWHHENRANDGVLRHPADSEAWKNFDRTYESFGANARNVRLGLATDGFNPFGDMNVSHSCWPVLLFPYNLPPWMCMKEPYIFMSLLIPGPKSPGQSIDVYLMPLIDELKQLWKNGVTTYDASTRVNFQMRVAVMWTINDFPGYAYMSGWQTQGNLACPVCMDETDHLRLRNGRKTVYMGHRRFLPLHHRWHNDKKHFNKKIEKLVAPKRRPGDYVFNFLQSIQQVTFGKTGKKEVIPGCGVYHNWKKRSIFWELPYWKTLLLRHNLDVMHIENNILDNVLGTLLNMKDKTKDSHNARLDLEEMDIRKKLHPKKVNGKTVLPPACYTLSNVEKEKICKWLENLKVPDGYFANISRCVNVKKRKIYGMKTHDCHVFLERLLPLVVRDLKVSSDVVDALTELSIFFKELCAKVLRVDDLDRLDQQIAITLCKLERIFPPAFFDIMVHLPVHLSWEAQVGGPVQYRWMYPIERHLRKLKAFVRNKARPERSIAEGYLANECLTFCSRYLHGIETKFNRPKRNDDGGESSSNTPELSIFSTPGRHLGKGVMQELSTDLMVAIFYIIQNCDEALPFVEEHKNILTATSLSNIDEVHRRDFISWFKHQISSRHCGSSVLDKNLLSLARGPDNRIMHYSAYNINGIRFHTKESEKTKKTQNSGVMVRREDGDIPYYEVITDILELSYTDGNNVVLFDCDWYDVDQDGIGFKKDKYGIISINTKKRLNTQEPFVLANQATQVYYVPEIENSAWSIVVETKPRNVYEMPIDEEAPYQEEEANNVPLPEVNDVNDEVVWIRDGVDDIIVDDE